MKLKRIAALALTLALLLSAVPAQALGSAATEPAIQETTVPETTEPEMTLPETTEPETTGEPACDCAAPDGVHEEGCPLYAAPTEEETLPQETTFEIPVWDGEETAPQLNTGELYEALMSALTLREAFILCNENVDSLWGLNPFQVFDIEAYVKRLYEGYDSPTEDETEAYEQMLDNVLTLKTELGVAECTCAIPYEHDVDCPMFNGKVGWEPITAYTNTDAADTQASADIYDDKIQYNKTIVDDGSGNLAIQIEAWTEGRVYKEDTQIVMVIDQSGSMLQAVNKNEWMTYDQLNELSNEEKLNAAAYPGYYMVVAQNPYYLKGAKWKNKEESGAYVNVNYKFDRASRYVAAMVRYDPGEQCWYRSKHTDIKDDQFPNLEVKSSFRDMDTWYPLEEDGTSNSIDANWNFRVTEAGGEKNSNGELIPQAKYFKSIYGASMDGYKTLQKELEGISQCSIAVVGFSSPASFGTGWDGLTPDDNDFRGLETFGFGGTGAFISSFTEDENGETVQNVEFRPSKNALPVDGAQEYGTQLANDDLKDIFVPIQPGKNTLLNIVSQIRTNYSQTCTEDGLLLAKQIFEYDSEKNPDKNVKRIVVLFTDGEPTYAAGTKYANRYDASSGTNTIKNATLTVAYELKNTYNARIYAFGHDTIPAAGKKLLEYQSSNYPTAEKIGSTYTKESDRFYGVISKSDDLHATFQSMGQYIFEENNALDETAELRDIVTPYFSIGGEYNGGVTTVYDIPYRSDESTGKNAFAESEKRLLYSGKLDRQEQQTPASGEPDPDPEAAPPEGTPWDPGTNDPAKNLSVTVNWGKEYVQVVPGTVTEEIADGPPEKIAEGPEAQSEDAPEVTPEETPAEVQTQTRVGAQVIVTGYDYSMVSVNMLEAGGAKLRLTIPIKPADEFVGGNYVATNSSDSGLYPKGSNEPLVEFKQPHVDVPVRKEALTDSTIHASPGSLYLGTEVSYQDVLSRVTLTIMDVAQKLDISKENYGLDAWNMDYVNVKVDLYDTSRDQEGDLVASDTPLKPEETILIDRDRPVEVQIHVWPKYKENSTELQETCPEDIKPLVGHVDFTVYYPTFAFNDVSLYYGQPLSEATARWNSGSLMAAQDYLHWYTLAEYGSLTNPDSSLEWPEQTDDDRIASKEHVSETQPNVFFAVNPIDASSPAADKDYLIETGYYQKYSNYMGRMPVQMNVRVYMEAVDDPENPPTQPSSIVNTRDAFFLHLVCGEEDCDHTGCQVAKHTSGMDGDYWEKEFYILPKTCQLTIQKTGGVPGEVYVFSIKTDSPAAGGSEEDPVDYMMVSITADDQGAGQTTICDLPVGRYWVEENTEWAWRVDSAAIETKWGYYDDGQTPAAAPAVKAGNEVELKPSEAEHNALVVIKNPNPVEDWLNGFSTVIRNIFGQKQTEN